MSPTAEMETQTLGQMVRVGDLSPSPLNPRKHFDGPSMTELTENVQKRREVIVPLIVRHTKAGRVIEVVDGERRLRAAKAAGLESVPVIFRDDLNDGEVIEIQLLSALQRQDLTPLEEAAGYQALIASNPSRYSAGYIADRIGRSERYGQQYTCNISSWGVSSESYPDEDWDDEGDRTPMADVVNLDALIEREDFLAVDGADAGQEGKNEISRTDLLQGESFYSTLRKPDFQRETAAWSPEAVCQFIEAFIDGDLIPSVICWQSPSRLSFIIDGAHRLSALIAWLSDDYGAGTKSIKFYNNIITDEQRRVAQETKDLINRRVGAYADYVAESQNPGSNPKLTIRARALAHSKIPLLWIRKQDSKKAEHAFLTINRSGVQIDATELRILHNRFTPSAVAARVVVRNATGFQYWKGFTPEGRSEFESAGKALYQALYSPPLQAPIRTIELPIAGHGYGSQTLPLVYDIVNIANGLKVVDASGTRVKVPKKKAQDDAATEPQKVDEDQSLDVIRQTQQLARMLTGTHPSSLGLHPAIYFYALDGKHQPTAVMAVAAMVKEFEAADRLLDFCAVRASFEAFLKEHKMFINQLTTFHGSMAKGYRQVKDYLVFVFDCFLAGDSADSVTDKLRKHDKYQRLVKSKPVLSARAKSFSQELKTWAFLKDALAQSSECYLCHAAMDNKSMQLDHKKDKKDGGVASGDNAAWTHPYCNSTYKDYLRLNGKLTV